MSILDDISKMAWRWWKMFPQDSNVLAMFDNPRLATLFWNDVTKSSEKDLLGRILRSRREIACGRGSIGVFVRCNQYSEDKIRGIHTKRMLVVFQGEDGWMENLSMNLSSFPDSFMSVIIKP